MDDNLYLMARSHHLAAIQLVCLVMVLIAYRKTRGNVITREEMLHRRQVREEMLHNLLTGGNCRQLIRMSENAFALLCQKLKNDGGLRATQRMTIEEQVARFLHIVGNDLKNRFVSWCYRRSGSATSRSFHRVLNAIISLEEQYIIQPSGATVQKEIQTKRRFFPFFKDCLGAIDGTHVRVKVPSKDAPRYRGRKGYPTINVLATCTFDLKFTYVLSGWEGTASDSRVLKDALTREDKLLIPDGKFYLVDGGLPLKRTLLPPYRGVRYHLKEYSTRAPQNPRELFDLRHASLRNSIERAFGVLKRRFPIIRSASEPFYSCKTQSHIFLACCILHNFMLDEDRDIELEEEVTREVLNGRQYQEPRASRDASRDVDDGGEQLRALIANGVSGQRATYGVFNYVFEKKIKLNPGPNKIILLSVTIGLQNYGPRFDLIQTGVRGPVQIVGKKGDETIIKDLSTKKWYYKVGLDGFDNKFFSGNTSEWRVDDLPISRRMVWYKTTFKAPLGNDPVSLDLEGLGKGVAWVNGNNIGRYWPSYIAQETGCSNEACDYRGPYNNTKCVTNCGKPTQKWYHVPRSFLVNGDNELVLFEEYGGNPLSVNFQTVRVGTTCGNAYENKTMEISCQNQRISSIRFASFGDVIGSCGSFIKGSCEEDNDVVSVIQKKCVGKETCSIEANEEVLGSTNCNHGVGKRLVVEAVCA